MIVCDIFVVWILLLISQSDTVIGDEKMSVIETSEEKVLVKEGGSTSMSCTTDQEWFFCLWRHPNGLKECLIQENNTQHSACSGMDDLDIQGRDKSCSLDVSNVKIEDHGVYMCLLNQADVFHTARSYFQLQVATPAEVWMGRKFNNGTIAMQQVENTTMMLVENEVYDAFNEDEKVLDLMEGEVIELMCEGKNAFPLPQIVWNFPQNQTKLGIEVS